MIKGKLVVIDNLNLFKTIQQSSDPIPDSAVVFIKNEGQIWTKGSYFGVQKTYTTVSKTDAGLAPKGGDSASSLISNVDTEWVLTVTSGASPSWRKLPANAFKNTTYTFYNLAFKNSAGTTVDTYKPTTSPTKTVKAGSNVTISASDNVITIAATDTTYSVMGGASADNNGTSGLVPQPTKGNQAKFLRADGSWATPTNTTYSVVTAAKNGLVPMFDVADGTIDAQDSDWVLTNNNGSIGWYKLPANAFNNSTYSVMSGATTSADGTQGLVPKPTKSNVDMFLKGDGTWATPTNTTYSVVTKTANGLVPKTGTTASATISSEANEWVLTTTSGNTPTWRKLPSAAFTTASYTLPTATTSALGGIKVGSVNTDAFANLSGKFYSVNVDKNGLAYVQVPWTDTTYTLPTATSSKLGGVKVGTTLTDVTGYTAVHIKDGVIYYKDTNSTNYLPLSGGKLSTNTSNVVLTLDASTMGDQNYLQFYNAHYSLGYLGFSAKDNPVYRTSSGTNYKLWHTGNLTNLSQLTDDVVSGKYLPISSYTPSDILTKLKTVDGSGSGLDADLLDGVHYQNILEREFSGSTTMNARGWYRIARMKNYATGGNSLTLYLYRHYNYDNNEAYVFNIAYGYGQYDITQVAGDYATHLLKKIRIDSILSGSQSYIDVYYDGVRDNTVKWIIVGSAESYTSAELVTELTGTALEFETTNGCKSNDGFVGDLYGNASSATKLQTARTIWGQSFDGTGNVDGNIVSANATFNMFANTGKELLSYSTENKYLSLGYGTLADSFTTYLHGYNINLRYGANGTDGLILNSSGNVGIGTSSPLHKLTVNGVIGCNELQCTNLGTGTYNVSSISLQGSGLGFQLEGALESDSSSASALPITFSWRGGFASKGGVQLNGGDGNSWLNILGSEGSLRLFSWNDGNNYIESGNKSFESNAPLKITGIGGNNGSDLYLNFNNTRANGAVRALHGYVALTSHGTLLSLGAYSRTRVITTGWTASESDFTTIYIPGSSNTNDAYLKIRQYDLIYNGNTVIHSGNWSSFITASAGSSYLGVLDTRYNNYGPYENYSGKVTWHLKLNEYIGLNAANSSLHSGVLNLSPWGDRSAGCTYQVAFCGNGDDILFRSGQDSYGSWHRVYHTGNLTFVT